MNKPKFFESFELMDLTVNSSSRCASVRLVVIYRPQMTADKCPTAPRFFNEFSSLLEELAIYPGHIMVCGDFNIHVDDVANSNTALLNDVVISYNLNQHVRSPTHEAGHTLDLILTRFSDDFVLDDSITISNILPSDHALVECILNISKPPPNKIVIKTRKFREIDIDAFRCDITKSALFLAPSSELVTVVEQYENILSDLLNRHAPEITRTITARPHAPWYCDSLREAKRDLRRWERLRNSTNLEVYKQVFRDQRARYRALLNKARCEYHINSFEDCNTRQLFQKFNKLSSSSTAKVLPSKNTASDAQLANQFVEFFSKKVKNIRNELSSHLIGPTSSVPGPSSTINAADRPTFAEFSPVTKVAVKRLVVNSPSSSCDQDPIPTWLVKKCVNELAPVLTRIINLSLMNGRFPDSFKHAQVDPLIKKSGLDPEVLTNYRPIAKLKFLGKLVERASVKQTHAYLDLNGLYGRLIGRTTALRQQWSASTMTYSLQLIGARRRCW